MVHGNYVDVSLKVLYNVFLTVEVNLVLLDTFNDRKRLPFRSAIVTFSLVELATTIRDDNVFPFNGQSKNIPKTS